MKTFKLILIWAAYTAAIMIFVIFVYGIVFNFKIAIAVASGVSALCLVGFFGMGAVITVQAIYSSPSK